MDNSQIITIIIYLLIFFVIWSTLYQYDTTVKAWGFIVFGILLLLLAIYAFVGVYANIV